MDKYIILFNNKLCTVEHPDAIGTLEDPTSKELFLTEFDMDHCTYGSCFEGSYDNGKFTGTFSYEGTQMDATFNLTSKSVYELDPDFDRFIELIIPTIISAHSHATEGGEGDYIEGTEINYSSY